MAEFLNIIATIDSEILTVTVNRPDKLNALNLQTIAEIGQAVENGNNNNSVKGIIITGSGNKAFVAGADISEFANYTTEEAMKLSAHGHKVFDSLENSKKPIIAAINGFALGGGCELAMACHLRIAADNAKFGQPEVKLGLIPGYGGTQRLPQLIGKAKALELLMTGDMIDAQEAYRLGLVNEVVKQDELMSKCIELLRKILAQAPIAISEIVNTVNAHYSKAENGFTEEIARFGKCFETQDFKEGSSAFLEKRKPKFTGE
jgi:enoyl-CoA hydratase